MHTRSMDDSEGVFQGEWQKSARPCPSCSHEGEHFFVVWESNDGAYEDERHECRHCGKKWWVDGIDS